MPTVLILGATSDMGYAIAKKFAAEGYDIQLAARKPEQLQAYQSDIQIRHNRQCSVHAFDALDFASHAAFYQSLSPKPDISICVVGYMNENEKVIADWNETLKTINTNYIGAISILNLIAADYSRHGKGTIVGISSVAGNRGRQSNYIYGSAKAGFTAYLSGLRNAVFKNGVHVMTVLPGFVNTKMTEHLQLPKPLTAQPADVATVIYNGVLKKSNIVYVKWFWRWIMLIITSIPEGIFKKLKL
ncbi:MAG TPA: SDR family oxidoreductase [Chitinophagaceae bacterium]|nr:SDR family oxidoreductase [Chitinophagaceae bacterium]